MSILYKLSHYGDNITGDDEKNLRISLLSRNTYQLQDFVKEVASREKMNEGEAYKATLAVLNTLEHLLGKGEVVHFDDFGSFSLNGAFKPDKEKSEKRRAESICVNKVVFRADKSLKARLTAQGFEKFNEEVHIRRKY